MNRDEIIRMALEAGFESSEYGYCTPGMYAYNMGIVERFYRAAYAAGAAAEREACAKVVIDMVDNGQGVVDRITAAIRARGNV